MKPNGNGDGSNRTDGRATATRFWNRHKIGSKAELATDHDQVECTGTRTAEVADTALTEAMTSR